MMKVKYDSSLWGSGSEFYGIAQKINWKFEHGGLSRCVPCIYRFRDGMVFDLLTFLDEDAVKTYFEKYKEKEDQLTDSEYKMAKQESPYGELNISKIYIDNQEAEEGYSSSAIAVIPWEKHDENGEVLRNYYHKQLKNTTCFSCSRFKVPYPKTQSVRDLWMRKWHLNKIQELKIIVGNTDKFYSINKSIVLSEQQPTNQLLFESPIDGVQYTVYLEKEEETVIPHHEGSKNFFVTSALYELVPELPQCQYLEFDSSINYHVHPSEDFLPEAENSFGIIGGSCGPTAIFGVRKSQNRVGRHGLPLQSCFSKIALCKQSEAEIFVKGIHRVLEDSKTYCYKKKKT